MKSNHRCKNQKDSSSIKFILFDHQYDSIYEKSITIFHQYKDDFVHIKIIPFVLTLVYSSHIVHNYIFYLIFLHFFIKVV